MSHLIAENVQDYPRPPALEPVRHRLRVLLNGKTAAETTVLCGSLRPITRQPTTFHPKGNCYENSMVETLFKSIKAELIWRNKWDTRRQAEGAIFQYINGFYNPRRRHSSLGGKSPLAFERKAA